MIHPACAICRGACCEYIFVSTLAIPDEAARWIAYHGETCHGGVNLPLRCTKLGPDGTCLIYETRPRPCETFPVGGPQCRQAITRQRSQWSDTYKLIMEALDSNPQKP